MKRTLCVSLAVLWCAVAVMAIGFCAVSGCSGADADPRVGGLYSVDDGEGSCRVAKILAVDDKGIHIRLYKNKWTERPDDVDEQELSLGTIHDEDGFGMGHLPLSRDAFRAWNPVFVKQSDFSEDELDGYRMWQEAEGQVFGD